MRGPASILTLVCPFLPSTVESLLVNQRNASAHHLGSTIWPQCGTAGHGCGVSLWEGCQTDADSGFWIGWNQQFGWAPSWRHPSLMTRNAKPPGAKYSEKSKNHLLHLQVALSLCTFVPVTEGAAPVARLTARDQSTPTLQRADDCAENISCCRCICHRHRLHELLGDGQCVINSADENGQLCNICNVRAFIDCSWKRNKRL